MIACQRQLFDIPRDRAYLNCAYFSPQLRSVSEVGERSMRRKATPWVLSPDDFFADARRLRQLFAQIVGGQPEEVALTPSASYGISLAAANTKVEAGQNVVVLAEQFPSNVYPWKVRAEDANAELRRVPRPAGFDWTEGVLQHIDSATAAVAVPHFHWTDGSRVDLDQVSQRCREVGAVLTLDLTQSLGASPFSVANTPADFIACAGYKWLLGPYSLGYLWVHPRHHGGRPFEHNWINRKDSENFAGLVELSDEFQPGARRFDVGENSNFALLPMALRALEQILEWGVANIATSIRATTDAVADGARAMGFEVAADRERAPHLLGLRAREGVPANLVAHLATEKVHISQRGRCLRIAPHLYNDEQDILAFLQALKRHLPGSTG